MPKAKDTFLLGFHGEVHAGEDVPRTYTDTAGEHDTDFDDLAERGLVDKAAAAKAEKAADVQVAKAHVAAAKAELKAADPPKPVDAPKSADEPKPASHKK
jgi:hypothetical protein